ncbi:MAG: MerR family transcriptional regulator [Actinomycetota bacterium]|nr:MerR family transcriptional regulator [Actinomycetota bacterium]
MGSPLGFRGQQACKLAGITYRQLDYWARTGLVRPSVADAHGSGTQRSYSYRDILELKVIKHLLSGGISLQAARKAVEYLRANLKEDLSNADVLVVGPGTVLVRTGEELINLLRGGQLVMSIVLSLQEIVNELDAAIIAMNSTTGENGEASPARSIVPGQQRLAI